MTPVADSNAIEARPLVSGLLLEVRGNPAPAAGTDWSLHGRARAKGENKK